MIHVTHVQMDFRFRTSINGSQLTGKNEKVHILHVNAIEFLGEKQLVKKVQLYF